MACDRAIIVEFTDFAGDEREGRAGVLAVNDRRSRRILINDDIVLRTFAVHKVDLNRFAFVDDERGIDLVVDVAADADVDHASFSDAGAEGEYDRRVGAGRRICFFFLVGFRLVFLGWRVGGRGGLLRHMLLLVCMCSRYRK